MSLFDVTQEELDEAKKGMGNPEFDNGQEVHFTITEVSEKDSLTIIGCVVDNTEHQGRTFKHFLRDNPAGKSIAINILKAFFTDEEIITKGANVAFELIGKKVKSVAKVTAKLKDGETKKFCNFYNFTAMDDGINIGGAGVEEVQASDIPF